VTQAQIVQAIEESVLFRDPDRVQEVIEGMENGTLSSDAILKALTKGMERARRELREGQRSIPEFLLCIDSFRRGVHCLKTYVSQLPQKADGIVIGVVEGDVHDMGKNIVAAVLEASGYPVYDLGRDVPRDTFLESIEKTRASLVALSTMMSTPLENMRDVIRWVRKLHPTTGILVGGAPLDERLAKAMGADGYAEGAADVPEEAERVLGLRKGSEVVSAVCRS
jgi:methanogenic corrinoid protein MtbC1